jgi:hypothetical protein
MSMSEPFMPAHEPRDYSKPIDDENDEDAGVDVLEAAGVDDPDAERAAEKQRACAEDTSFHTPQAGVRLTAEQLDEELNS